MAWMGVYLTYSVTVLLHWIWDWQTHHGLKRWFLGLWWLGEAPEMAIPTFPSSLSLNGLLAILPGDFVERWQNTHSFESMILVWAWYVVVGFIQWFVLVPLIWSRIRRVAHTA